jgi:hypothetical protein
MRLLVAMSLLVSCAPSPAPPEAKTATSSAVAERAEVGKPAPDFTLVDLEGRSVSLHDYRGKIVVLEWFNPGCPFVKMSHTKGSLVGTAKRHIDKGVVWLAVNSAAEGKQGYGREANLDGKQRYGMEHPILVDTSGATGHAYGATNTPHMFVIDKGGALVYKGAIDNSPDGEGQSPTNGKLVNYVDLAIDALDAGRPVEVRETQAYGCSVKYGH